MLAVDMMRLEWVELWKYDDPSLHIYSWNALAICLCKRHVIGHLYAQTPTVSLSLDGRSVHRLLQACHDLDSLS